MAARPTEILGNVANDEQAMSKLRVFDRRNCSVMIKHISSTKHLIGLLYYVLRFVLELTH